MPIYGTLVAPLVSAGRLSGAFKNEVFQPQPYIYFSASSPLLARAAVAYARSVRWAAAAYHPDPVHGPRSARDGHSRRMGYGPLPSGGVRVG